MGYTEREVAFLYLVALHSGFFLRRQYGRFVRRERGASAGTRRTIDSGQGIGMNGYGT
ncbi:MAG: hypothetical protein ACYDC6_12980 [Acidobacteriaceae bacterium]